MKNSMKKLLSMIILNIAILTTTLTIHEIGHALAGKALGCVSAKAVVFDSTSMNPYTELSCQKEERAAYAAGLILTTIFGLSFLVFEKPHKALSLVIIGFGIFLASLDIVELTGLSFTQHIFIFWGLASLIIGQILYGIYSVKE
jgi:hypothetical protein